VKDLLASFVPEGTFGLVITVVLSVISMMQAQSREISLLLNGRTRTATFTEDILQAERESETSQMSIEHIILLEATTAI
jgi:hypothetical protein